MTDADLKAFIEFSCEIYIADRVTNGGEDPREAEEGAATEFAAHFPGGEPGEGHHLLTGHDTTTGEPIGTLWLFEHKSAAGTSAFIYDVEVVENRRGQGWGRELMMYVEQWASERGAREIALNVFGGNAVARGLYGSLGYRERAVDMVKSLTS